jgi:glutamate-ammonia-ligase adenylyltransferase
MPVSCLLDPALHWSGHLRRRLQAHPDLAAWVETAAPHRVTPNKLAAWHAELSGANAAESLPVALCRATLRKLRERVFCTLMVRDLAGLADLEEVVGAMTALADLAIGVAYRSVAAELTAVHGVPRDPTTGASQEMLIVGMGKLGGDELNVSSDVDLIMLYAEEGETDGQRCISHHEFYGRLTRRMMLVLSEVDPDGIVFRTDLRLRPDGDVGPLAWNLNALEHYLITQGREWERYAWIKARVIPAHAFRDSDSTVAMRHLESLRIPFVYRKYFDFDALAALRTVRQRIRQDWQRRVQARDGVESEHNIKLGDGGIREIEFIVQLFQLIRGGRMPALQKRGLLAALHAERDAGLISVENACKLEEAYRFLRRTEHALQYREDEQTHLLPRDAQQRADLATALGYDPGLFDKTLTAHRAFVSQTFRNAFRLAGMGDRDPATTSENKRFKPPPDAQSDDAETWLTGEIHRLFGADAGDLPRRVVSLLTSHRLRSLPHTSRQRVETLLPITLEAARRTSAPVEAAVRLFDLIESIAQRSAYLALLAEYPDTLARVARMMAASPWAAHYLIQHPLLLDSLIDWRTLFKPLDFAQMARQLAADLDACCLPSGEPDIERQMNLMRDVQRQASFQLLAQDLEGELTVERLADQLSALADMLLDETVRRVWPLVNKTPGASPQLSVIAYGKLGGKELSYASDLDLVFLFDDDREDAAEVYAKLGRRMTSWLSTMTSSGRLYDVDLRLRPDGEAGLLAISVQAFEQYQREHAWVWEHQALTRARHAAGNTAVGEKFERVRGEIMLQRREPATLQREVKTMRDKLSAGHRNKSGNFDLKHDRGGMVDVEFVTQYLVLCHAADFPMLVNNLGNIALLRMAGEAGLIPVHLAFRVGDAYRIFRRIQHQMQLRGIDHARVPPQELHAERTLVEQLWHTIFG